MARISVLICAESLLAEFYQNVLPGEAVENVSEKRRKLRGLHASSESIFLRRNIIEFARVRGYAI